MTQLELWSPAPPPPPAPLAKILRLPVLSQPAPPPPAAPRPPAAAAPRGRRWVERWTVASRSGAAPDPAGWTVARDVDGRLGCSCPRWIYFREECAHIRALRAELAATAAAAGEGSR
jgi:hypothetical protein